MSEKTIKPLIWIGSSKKDILKFPEPVKDVMGYAIHLAQMVKNILTPNLLKDLVGQKHWKWLMTMTAIPIGLSIR